MRNVTSFPDLLTVSQASEVLHVSQGFIWKHIRAGDIPAFKNPNGKYLIPRKYFDDLARKSIRSNTAKNSNHQSEGG